jgi:hypothetical protein
MKVIALKSCGGFSKKIQFQVCVHKMLNKPLANKARLQRKGLIKTLPRIPFHVDSGEDNCLGYDG